MNSKMPKSGGKSQTVSERAKSSQSSKCMFTGKSLSEALIFASINPQYDKRLFMELP